MKVCFISITIFYIKLNFIYFQILDALVKVYSSSSYLLDRKSTRLNSSHLVISYAVFCLKKKTNTSEVGLLTTSLTPSGVTDRAALAVALVRPPPSVAVAVLG